METIAFWAPWVTLALILAVPLEALVDWVWSGRRPNLAPPNPWTIVFALIFFGSYFVTNAFHAAFWLLEPPHAYGLALRLYTLSGWLLYVGALGLFAYTLLTNKVLPRPDLQAKLLLVILFIAEAFEPLQYVGCKIWYDPLGDRDPFIRDVWGISVDRFACGRALGLLHPYVAPVIYTLFALRVLWARRHDRESRYQNHP